MTNRQSVSSSRSCYRGRFAPSPTGPLHFGSLVAALGSYLQARQQNGQWWLRIEDIDPPREVPGAADHIIHTLGALGFEWDELIYQSQRLPQYRAALDELQSRQLIYPCTCTRRELREQQSGTDSLIYPGHCRDRRFPCHERHALRILTRDAVIDYNDQIAGPQHCELESEVGDYVLRRADGYVSYQLAVAFDDADQGMSEVIRGSDLLASTPRQIYIQQQLGLASPAYGHLPVVLNPAGQKLSKQTGAQPIASDCPTTRLCQAMTFLGQTVPEEIFHASLPTFWDWAINHWSLSQVPTEAHTPPLTADGQW